MPDELKVERHERFMRVQSAISREKLRSRQGQTLAVMIDEVNSEVAVGRSYADSPEIDGAVYINSSGALQSGDLVSVTITDSGEHDLYGNIS